MSTLLNKKVKITIQCVTGLLTVTFLSASPAVAENVTLTVKDGRALVVGDSQELGDGLSFLDLTPAEIVTEFRRLCLPDPSGASERVETSSLVVSSNDAVFKPRGKQGEARVKRWSGTSAELSIWSGDGDNLKNRPIAMPSRGATTTGPYGPFKAFGDQCNLVVKLTNFSSVAPLTDELTKAFGEPGKLVLKKTFADGHWWIADSDKPWRINLNTPTTRYGAQPVHLSVQLMDKWPKRKKKK